MAEKRTIELEIQDNSKSLKAQYREAVAELQKVTEQYGATSREAAQAAAKAAQLKDEIQYSKDLVGAFNPDAKFNALSKSIGGVLDGFQAFEGAMGLVGVEGEAVQATMLKVQSAMALSQGIQGVMEAKDSFMQLGTVIRNTAVGQAILTAATTAYNIIVGTSTGLMKAFKIALISTGIGALVVGVGLLIANFDKLLGIFTPVINGLKMLGDYIGITNFKQAEQDAILKKSAANRIAEIKKEKDLREKLFASLEKNYSTQDKAMDRQIALLKAQGKDTTALERARIKATIRYQTNLQNETYQMWVQGKEKNKLILQELYAMGVREKNFAEYNEKLKLFTEAQNELARDNHKANEARLDAINQLAIFEAEVLKANQQNQSNYRQETTRQEYKSAQEQIDIKRRLEDEKLRITTESRQKDLDALDLKYTRLEEDAKKELANDKDKEEKLKKLKEQYAESKRFDVAEINKKWDKIDYDNFVKAEDERIKAEDAAWNELQKLKNSQKEQELLDLAQSYDEKFLLAKGNAELEKALTEQFNKDQAAIIKKYKDQEEADQKERDAKDLERRRKKEELILMSTKDSLQIASDLTQLFAGKSKDAQKKAFVIQKGINIANATVDTYGAATKALREYPSPFNYIAMAAAITTGLLNIKKIKQTQFETGGGGGGNNAPAGANAPAPMTANFSTIGSSGINQLAQLQQKPTQAYVVSGEVTSAQALDRNRVQNATL